MATLVMKFGGAAVGTSASLQQVLRIITQQAERWQHVLVVVSALDGVTDALLEAAKLAQIDDTRSYRRITANLRSRHFAMIEQLILGSPEQKALHAEIDQLLSNLLDACQQIAQSLEAELAARDSDRVVAVGERMAAHIVAAALRQRGIRSVAVDGAELLITDDRHGNANPDLGMTAQNVQKLLAPMLQRGTLPVVTGFIGKTAQGATTTVGRGGTDYSASILSALLPAQAMWLWANVDGIMTADPRLLANARTVPKLSYQEAADLANFGARILHTRMIGPLADCRLPLQIKNIHDPDAAGTLVAAEAEPGTATIKAVTSIHGMLLRCDTLPAPRSAGSRSRQDILRGLGWQGPTFMEAQAATSSRICVLVPTSLGSHRASRLEKRWRKQLDASDEGRSWQIEPVVLVTLVGRDLQRAPRLLAQCLEQIDGQILHGLGFGASHSSFTLVLPLAAERESLKRLHELVLKMSAGSVATPSA